VYAKYVSVFLLENALAKYATMQLARFTAVFTNLGGSRHFEKIRPNLILSQNSHISSAPLSYRAMPYRKISRDLKLAAIRLYERDLLPLEDILDCIGFSERTFERIRSLWNRTGDVVKHHFGTQGHPRLLHLDDINYLLCLVRQWPDWFLDELLHLLETNRFICVNYVTIHRTLVRAGASLKKLKKIAMERNEAGRNAFIQHMAQYDPDELGFIDETSKNEKTGRARKGQCAEMRQRFVRGRRLTATSLLTVNGITTSKVIEGSMTKSLYLEFLEQEVVRMTSILSLSPLLTANWNTDAPLHSLSRSIERACNG